MSNPSRQVVIAESALGILVPAFKVCRDPSMRINLRALIDRWLAVLAAEGAAA